MKKEIEKFMELFQREIERPFSVSNVSVKFWKDIGCDSRGDIQKGVFRREMQDTRCVRQELGC